MSEFDLNGVEYRIGKLSAIQQLHVSRRIAPLIPPLVPLFAKFSKEGLTQNLASLPEAMQPMADALANLSDDSAEYVVTTCMSVVRRREGDQWMPVWNARAGMAQYEDLNDVGTMLNVVVRVITDNLSNFMRGLPFGQQPDSK